ncbi:MAG: site-2 protease family protein [Chloroflexi bacterium]|nr:site-2 protease family protein [Chloroflexota bacterium]MDA8187988.1 site-2 protease family protein [Dehalococcoidales bacterium]
MFYNINFTELAIGFAILTASIGIHEASHAFMAYRLGDNTAKYLGRLTLNPIAHMDPLGSIMILMTMVNGFGIGWGKPTPVNPYNLRNGPKTGMAMVSLAGPLSNLTLAAFLALPFRLHLLSDPALYSVMHSAIGQWLPDILGLAVMWNIGLAAFNIIPLPPLDGFKILQGILPNRQAYALSALENYGPALLLLVIFVGPFLGINLLWYIMRPIMAFFSLIIVGSSIF